VLNKRRIVIDFTRAGWIGWSLFVLVAVQLLLRSFLRGDSGTESSALGA
jgi:hypothetical protein